jgi:hypothetical protein
MEIDMSNDTSRSSLVRFAGATVGGLVFLWFIFTLMMASDGRYISRAPKPPLALGLSCLLPIIFFIWLYLRRGAFWAFCHTIDLRTIVALNLGRILAVDFVLCAAEGRLPAGFALPAGLGDIVIGLTAIPLAFALSSGRPAARAWFVAWNCFGMLDLVLAISLGILHSSSTVGILAGTGPNTLLMSELPRALVPAFFVPLLILLHLLALARTKELATMSGSAFGGIAAQVPVSSKSDRC